MNESRTRSVAAETATGRVRGLSCDGVNAFKGVPYGAATGGRNRFRAPRAPEPWTGELECFGYGPSAPQPTGAAMGQALHRPTTSRDSVLWGMPPYEAHQGEDCLVLNVWTPALDGGARPVMVWIHGGGFTTGSGSWPWYDGTALAREHDVVVVTVNHRLGALGYLHLAPFCDDPLATSAGQQDIVAALAWVRENVAAFGGDANNVTVSGQSGGGAKVCALLAMPTTAGQFHRAAPLSGPLLRVAEPDGASELAARFLADVGALTGSRADLDALAEMPLARIVQAQEALVGAPTLRRSWGPTLDGAVVTEHPFEALERGAWAKVPLLVGTTRDELIVMVASRADDDDHVRAQLASELGDHTDDVVARYRAERPHESPSALLNAIRTDQRMRVPSIMLCEHQARAGGMAFSYLFEWETTLLGRKPKSPHGIELPLLFANTASAPIAALIPSAWTLSERMAGAWTSFARSGVPSHPSLPTWPPYDADTRMTLIFDEECRVVSDPYASERAVWDALEPERVGL